MQHLPKSNAIVHVDALLARAAIVRAHVAPRRRVFFLQLHFATAFRALQGSSPTCLISHTTNTPRRSLRNRFPAVALRGQARRVVAERVSLPQGSYIEWSGRYENERRARERLQIVIPIVLGVIFVLLYLTYRSFLDATQVLLAVPFGLAGGIYLVAALGYKLSIPVWVGFIALFGTAVQTAVVMVIYLEEAVAQKREDMGGRLTPEALMEAVKAGALLRLRPKVMTVSTIVASLLPIMWSHSTGAEVMKPLATPVLGGMVSSLGLVLIVTPVIFYWLRERELRRAEVDERAARRIGERPALESNE